MAWGNSVNSWAIIAGSANPHLAAAIAAELHLPLAERMLTRFPDGEINIQLRCSLRRAEVVLVQPTAPPVNDHLVELLALADACRRAAAARITAVVPYFGYARADKQLSGGEPISASMVARLIEAVGIDQIIVVDLHAAQIAGFFQIPVDHQTALPVLAHALHEQILPGTVVVAPDAGRVKMATAYAQALQTTVAVLDKQHLHNNEMHITGVVGDVHDRPCLIVDDMIATASTVVAAVAALRAAGARPEISLAATHGLLLPGAQERLLRAGIHSVWITDTVAPPVLDWPQLRVVSVAPLLAAAIRG